MPQALVGGTTAITETFLPGTESRMFLNQPWQAICNESFQNLTYHRSQRNWAVTSLVCSVLQLFEGRDNVRRYPGLVHLLEICCIGYSTETMNPSTTGVEWGQRICHQGLPPCPLSVEKAPDDIHLVEGLIDLLPWGCTFGSFMTSLIHYYIPRVSTTFATAELRVHMNECWGLCAIAGEHSTFLLVWLHSGLRLPAR